MGIEEDISSVLMQLKKLENEFVSLRKQLNQRLPDNSAIKRSEWVSLNEFLSQNNIPRSNWYEGWRNVIKWNQFGKDIRVNVSSYERYLEKTAINKN